MTELVVEPSNESNEPPTNCLGSIETKLYNRFALGMWIVSGIWQKLLLSLQRSHQENVSHTCYPVSVQTRKISSHRVRKKVSISFFFSSEFTCCQVSSVSLLSLWNEPTCSSQHLNKHPSNSLTCPQDNPFVPVCQILGWTLDSWTVSGQW